MVWFKGPKSWVPTQDTRVVRDTQVGVSLLNVEIRKKEDSIREK